MALHRIISRPGRAAGLPAYDYYQQCRFFPDNANPDELYTLQYVGEHTAPAFVLMEYHGQRALLSVPESALPLVCDIQATGLGGRDSDANSPLAADTVYVVRVVCDPHGEAVGLIAHDPTVSPVLPAGYPWVSPILAPMVTDGAEDLYQTRECGQGLFWYDQPASYGVQVLTNGVAVGSTQVDLSSALPVQCCRYVFYVTFANATQPPRRCSLEHAGPISDLVYDSLFLATLAGYLGEEHQQILTHSHPFAGIQVIRYGWGDVPSIGTNLFVQGMWLPRV